MSLFFYLKQVEQTMKKFVLFFVFILLSFNGSACEFSNVSFTTDFSGARLTECKQQTDDRYLLRVEAENYPVNHSPWYAFKVVAKSKQMIKVNMEFIKTEKARYRPKISHDGLNWTAIRFKMRKNKLSYKLSVSEKPLFVAGQEIIANSHYVSWLRDLSKHAGHPVTQLGSSIEKRPIYQLESNLPNNHEWVVLLGRQHPPEITGALALFPFSQELLLNSKLAKAFRNRFNILLVPNLNPDGVEHGNWRHNMSGVDLNRDWGHFKQKETRLVKARIDQIIKDGGRLVFAIDFHSTFKDTLYTMPTDHGQKPAKLVERWVEKLEPLLEDFKFRIKPGSKANSGVFKQFITDSYGIHAITYEMGDNTDRRKINSVAKIAAQTFMRQMLATPAKEFVTNNHLKLVD